MKKAMVLLIGAIAFWLAFFAGRWSIVDTSGLAVLPIVMAGVATAFIVVNAVIEAW